MPTDKDAAEAWRTLAAYNKERNRGYLAVTQSQCAVELDPPKPEYPDGLYEFTSAINGFKMYHRREGGKWLDIYGEETFIGDALPRWAPRRLRVLADDEIAVKRDDSRPLLGGERTLRDTGYGASANWLANVIDALDAEDGAS